MKKLVLELLAPSQRATESSDTFLPIDGTRAYQMRSEGQPWEVIERELNCGSGAAKKAAERYAISRRLYIYYT